MLRIQVLNSSGNRNVGFVGGRCHGIIMGTQGDTWELALWMGNRELKMASSAEGHTEKPGRARVRWYNMNTLRTRQRGILCSNVGLSLA